MDTISATPTTQPQSVQSLQSGQAQSLATSAQSFRWTKKARQAARMVASEEKTMREMCALLKIGLHTLDNWKKTPIFAQHVDALRERYGELAARYAIARKARRLEALNDRWERGKQVIAERAASEEMVDVPGGKSGLLVHEVKQIGAGASAKEVDEYHVDTALMKEMRELEKQAAHETGQWIDQKHIHQTGAVLVLNVIEEVITPQPREVPLLVPAVLPAGDETLTHVLPEAHSTLPGSESLPR